MEEEVRKMRREETRKEEMRKARGQEVQKEAGRHSYSLGSVLGRMLRNAWQQCPAVYGIFAVYTLAAAVYPF